MAFRYPNKRIGNRASNGRFRRTTFRDVFGVDSNADPQICNNCGHGSETRWVPLVLSGTCPNCGSEDKRPVPPPEMTEEIKVKAARFRQIYPRGGFIHPLHVQEAALLERELKPWIKAGLI